MEEKTFELEEQPGYKLAIPLFLITALPFLAGMLYDFINRGETERVFIWFSLFYVLLSLVYLIRKVLIKKSQR